MGPDKSSKTRVTAVTRVMRLAQNAQTKPSSGVPDDPKRLIVVGDRVLITPEEGEERTNVGLYLPASALESRQVQGGRIVATGPGTPMAEPASMDDEPWKIRGPDVKYLPMQAEVGDYALFFRKAAVEITFEGKTYLVVPQAAILVLVRHEQPEPE